MTPEEKLAAIKAMLEPVAGKSTWDDRMEEDEDVYVDDFAGGNIDDAYSGGCHSGRVDLAREILGEFFND